MAKIIKSNKKRRYCRLSSCKRLLSIYNFSTYCYAHQRLYETKQVVSAASA